MQNTYLIFFTLSSIFFFAGCVSTTLETRTLKSYDIGQTKKANLGDVFLVDQDGSIQKVKRWVGLLNSPDGWQVTEEYSKDFIRKELIYAGKAGNAIEVSYREFRGGYAAPAFFQNLKYDLLESKIIRFQNFKIEILAADNQGIVYVVVSDH